MNEVSNDDSLLLMELRSISERSAAVSRFNNQNFTVEEDDTTTDVAAAVSVVSGDPTDDSEMSLDQSQQDLDILHDPTAESFHKSNAKRFLALNPENSNFNQYWYSTKTIEVLSQAILEILRKGFYDERKRVAFLSTPSLYFALAPAERVHCKLFDVSD